MDSSHGIAVHSRRAGETAPVNGPVAGFFRHLDHGSGMDAIAHDGRETPFRAVGIETRGPTAIYVHGSGGTHQVWAHQYGPDRPVEGAVALDLAGHSDAPDVDVAADGRSDADADPGIDAMEAYADDVVAVAEDLDADVLVGNSLGGAVVLHAVLEGRVAPSALVLAGSGAKLAVREDLRDFLAEDFQRAVETLHQPDALFHHASDERRERSMATMRAVGQRVVRRDFLTCHRFDVLDRLDGIDVPTLAITGEHDTLTPPSYHEYLAEEIPGGEWDLLEDAAHLSMLEEPDAFNEAVAAFVERALAN